MYFVFFSDLLVVFLVWLDWCSWVVEGCIIWCWCLCWCIVVIVVLGCCLCRSLLLWYVVLVFLGVWLCWECFVMWCCWNWGWLLGGVFFFFWLLICCDIGWVWVWSSCSVWGDLWCCGFGCLVFIIFGWWWLWVCFWFVLVWWDSFVVFGCLDGEMWLWNWMFEIWNCFFLKNVLSVILGWLVGVVILFVCVLVDVDYVVILCVNIGCLCEWCSVVYDWWWEWRLKSKYFVLMNGSGVWCVWFVYWNMLWIC